ncbi:MAG: alcohol dehydrogenase catalytic domain-containing protein [Propionibacteriaceae bacterium]|jgi:2-desacetyl-2-hydroxyethyl bacteriochlorophyllide A dehydrogenase|nr:alcohol dehydrogenase catalytic domain-containing protein [Propionibacteriaceae bacterium]
MSNTMPAAVWVGPDTIAYRDVPLPQIPPGWALVEVAYTGICGTDLSIVHGAHPRARPGLILGHEISGTVAQAGDGGPKAGTPVVVEPLISCGKCLACRSGATHVCRELGLYGIDLPGSLAKYVALPPAVLHEVPGDVDPLLATWIEPLAVAVHAVDLAQISPGDVVGIAGAGPVGLLTALVARADGAEVVISEPSDVRRAVAQDLGFAVVPPESTLSAELAARTAGEGGDIVCDASGHPATALEITKAARVHGKLVIVGVHKGADPLDLRDMSFKELSMVGVRVYTTADVRRAIELVAADALDLRRLPVKVFGLNQVAQAFDAAAAAAYLKVMVSSNG